MKLWLIAWINIQQQSNDNNIQQQSNDDTVAVLDMDVADEDHAADGAAMAVAAGALAMVDAGA